MLKKFSFVHTLFVVGTLLLAFTTLANSSTPDDDQRFLALRDAAYKEDVVHTNELARQLANYPPTSYVEYYQLRAHLPSAGMTEIQNFLHLYADSAIAERLRTDWLLMLGRQSNWPLFDTQYAQLVVNDDVQLKCYALLSHLKQGRQVATEARTLLTSSKVYGEGCYALFTGLLQSGQFTRTDIWNQIRWSAEANSTTVAAVLLNLANLDASALNLPTGKSNDKQAAWLEKKLAKAPGNTPDSHQMTVVLLGRLAKIDPDKAVALLTKFNSKLSDNERTLAWSAIALPASQKLLPEAGNYWKKAADAPLSPESYQWRVRTSLRVTDWPAVKAGILAMPATLQSEPAWMYWLGRAHIADNKPDMALPYFQAIAHLPNFYGQLALEECGLRITIPPSTQIAPAEVSAVESNPGLQRALQFYRLNLRAEGTREWNWQLRGMTERQMLAAAELARQNDLLDRMVSTSDRTKSSFDFNQRFPTPHINIMTETTTPLGLDMAWVYGLIRQESRFIQNARSSVGASGLMQVMPGTARYVIKKMKVDITAGQTNEIQTNIYLGTNYLNIILANLNGSQVLASAGYNAGPNRAKAWRANLSKPVEGAIFTETIPYTETRDYVKNVLSNATYYSALFLHTPQSLKARLGSISPNEPDIPLGN